LNLPRTLRARTPESGVALLISLFALLLICVVGIALIMASGTDSALTGNYHSATSVYYGALAGLEEGRGRMLAKSANYLPAALGLPLGSAPVPGQVWYILNPFPGETVAPWDQSTTTTFPDTEYQQEFGVPPPTSGPAMQQTNSVYTPPTVQVLPGPIYKWVRINAVTVASAQSAGVNVNSTFTYPPATPVLYANAHLYADPVTGGVPALEITSLAAMPNGSQRMLQYVVAPITYNLSFPAALTFEGTPSVTFAGPGPGLLVDGTDTLPLPPCLPSTPAIPPPAIGIAGSPSTMTISGASLNPVPTPPPATTVTVAPNLQSASTLQTLVQTVTQSADVADFGPETQSIFPATMSAANPVTIAVTGDLDLSTWTGTGYGTLLVTGTLTYNPASSWMGIVLVIGKGTVLSTGTGGGSFVGAVFVAQTIAGDGSLALGPASWSASGGATIKYSSCWVNAVQAPFTYKVLSFREIPQ
jgi:hypothetical protein